MEHALAVRMLAEYALDAGPATEGAPRHVPLARLWLPHLGY